LRQQVAECRDRRFGFGLGGEGERADQVGAHVIEHRPRRPLGLSITMSINWS